MILRLLNSSLQSHIVSLTNSGNTQTCLVIQIPTKLGRNSQAFKDIPGSLLNKLHIRKMYGREGRGGGATCVVTWDRRSRTEEGV